jgi:hypothetical protein
MARWEVVLRDSMHGGFGGCNSQGVLFFELGIMWLKFNCHKCQGGLPLYQEPLDVKTILCNINTIRKRTIEAVTRPLPQTYEGAVEGTVPETTWTCL